MDALIACTGFSKMVHIRIILGIVVLYNGIMKATRNLFIPPLERQAIIPELHSMPKSEPFKLTVYEWS
jgi:hypothetical protein